MIDLTPRRLIRSLRWRLRDYYPDYEGDDYECPLCKTQLSVFLPVPADYLGNWNDNQYVHPIFQLETMNFENYLCPACQGSDRDRLYALYLEQYLGSLESPIDLIEFAPTEQLRKVILQFSNVTYRSADLSSELADDVVDLQDMRVYEDERFDFFICSHILEHVDDDKAASRELFRILRKGGKGIAMVPIDLSLEKNYENPDVVTEGDRWAHFCQFDHVRLYSKPGFIKLFQEAGFQIEQFGINHFGMETFKRAGIHPRSVLYIAEKR
jgi:SAM-dependent methyltransferase